MENGYQGIGNNDVATLSLLSGGIGGYGRGGGSLYAGNSVLAAEAHANGTAVKEAVDCNKDLQAAQLDRISAQNLEGRANTRTEILTKSISDSEFRGIDRLRDIERDLVVGQKESALCCCETQKEMAAGFAATALTASENQAATQASIADLKTSNIERELLAAQSKINQLEIINAINSGNGHHRP